MASLSGRVGMWTTALRRSSLTLLLIGFSAAGLVIAQQAKRPLTHDVYDSWRSIQSQQISQDGKIVAYALVPQDGDGEVVVRNLESGQEFRHGRGARPEPSPQPEGGQPEPGPGPGPGGRGFGGPGGGQVAIGARNEAVVFTIYPTKDEVKQARKQRKRPDEMPKNALGIMNVSTGKVTRIDRVKRFQLPEEGGGFVAYLLEAKSPERRPEGGGPGATGTEERRPPEAGAATGGGPGTGRRPGARRKEFGTDLVVRNLTDNTERTFADVLDFTISDDGKALVYSVSAKQEELNGAFAITPLDAAAVPRALLKGKGQYTRFHLGRARDSARFYK